MKTLLFISLTAISSILVAKKDISYITIIDESGLNLSTGQHSGVINGESQWEKKSDKGHISVVAKGRPRSRKFIVLVSEIYKSGRRKSKTKYTFEPLITRDKETKTAAMASIRNELNEFAPTVENPLYRERIKTRVSHDLELLNEVGYCSGIENYTIHFDGRKTGEPPFCLIDFFLKVNNTLFYSASIC